MSWLLINDKYSEVDNKHFEGAFTQGNGYMNIRASFDEDLNDATQNDIYWRLPANVTLEKARNPKSKWGVYVPGIYGQHPILGEEIINLPYVLGLNIYCESEKLDMETSKYSNFTRTLNMKDGVLERKLTWHTKDANIDVKYSRYCSLQNKNLIVQELQLFSKDKNVDIQIENFIDASVTTNGYNHFEKVELEYDQSPEVYLTTDTKQHVGMYAKTSVDQCNKKDIECWAEKNRVVESFTVTLEKDKKISIKKYSLIVSSMDKDFKGEIYSHLDEAISNLESADIELIQHQNLWNEKWDKSGIVIEGDDSLQKSIRFSIYHLLRAVNDSNNVAIDAKGYAGEAYYGHYFWDTEIYLLPFFIYTQPEYAKKLVMYRYKTLNGAKENAKRYGYEGARYPWESCITGKEQCSNWQYSDLEVHVTADVIYGIWHYYRATSDKEFLVNEGLEMMVETARYWINRVDKLNGEYRLMGVMGPDEYLPFTNDNAFTNYMVKFVLSKTLEVIEMANKENSIKCESLKITRDEIEQIREISEKLVFLEDRDNKFIPQCDNFDEFLDVDFDKVWKDRRKPFGHFISQEKNYRSKALKQADVIALLYLFRNRFDGETKKKCLEYYEKITTHDSSLSYIIHSLVNGDIEENDRAYEFFNKSTDIDLGGKGASEGIHIANCGGMWQAVVMGFGGFNGSIDNEKLVISPKIPKHVQSITFKICLNNTWRKIIVTKEKALCSFI